MSTATIPQVWSGRSGREYVPVPKSRVRHGGMASVRKVTGRGGPVGTSTVADGVPLALKLWQEGDETSLDQMQREAKILVAIASGGEEIPCPRLFDLVGKPMVTGVVMEWCPVDLDRWWQEKMSAEDAVGRLMFTLAEAAQRVGEYHECLSPSDAVEAAHGDLKPSNLVLSTQGRWLVSDFGTASVAPEQDDVWAESRVIVASNNFVAPEVLFTARRDVPVATDVWSLAASLFALLRVKKLHEERGVLPRNGTHSARFRMERMNRVVEIFGRDPTRFVDRPLDPGVFPEPNRLPEDDRRSIRDSLRGCFGMEAPDKDEAFSSALIAVMDRAMCIEPTARFASCSELSSRFEDLGRLFIELSATGPEEGKERPSVDALEASRNEAVKRARALQAEVDRLSAALQDAEAAPRAEVPIAPAVQRAPAETEADLPPQPWHPPLWWRFAALAMLLLQLSILGILILQGVLRWTL